MAFSLVWSHTKTVRACNAPEIPPAEWEKHRELLKELYITQNKTLTEVKDHMRTRFGFSPSYVPAPVLPALTMACPGKLTDQSFQYPSVYPEIRALAVLQKY